MGGWVGEWVEEEEKKGDWMGGWVGGWVEEEEKKKGSMDR